MPRTNRKSWRLKFIDLDQSYSVVDRSTPISGFITCRAPKGEKRAMYFGPQNSEAIDAMIGVGSANWPDILEAQMFNSEYGIYISASPGTSDIYPSHLGGFYVAANGLYKFYNVTSKEELEPTYDGLIPPYKVAVNPGSEKEFDFTVPNSKIEIRDKSFTQTEWDPDGDPIQLVQGDVGALIVHGIHNKVFNKIYQFDYDQVIDGNVGLTLSTMYDSIEGKFVAAPKFGLTGVDAVQDDDTGLWTITLANFDLIKYNSSDNPTAGGFLSADMARKLVTNAGGDFSKLLELLSKGFVKLADGTKYDLGFDIADLLHIVVDIQSEVYFYVMQKSLTEKQTKISISNIEYDKYRYDQVFDYAKVDDFTALPTPTPKSKDYMAFYTESGGETVPRIFGKASLSNPEVTPATDRYIDNTDDFSTQFVTFAHPRDFDDDPATVPEECDALFRKIWYVHEGNLKHVYTLEECISLQEGDVLKGEAFYAANMMASPPVVAPKNPMFNTITFSCGEEVYVGSMTNGGVFQGSLDERGVNTYGENIYFPMILSDDDFSFVECRVIKKFGDEIDDHVNGFWTKKRIYDPFDMDMYDGEIHNVQFTIEGDRYAEFVMNMNLVEKKTGGIWRSEWYNIIRDGLKEALNPDYDDAYVFMEPTGQHTFAADLGTIRKAQEFATVISPFVIPSSAISGGMLSSIGAQKLVVPARHRAVSRFVGEFEVFDNITQKKYWCQPIGDVGLMLARIMDRKYGIWAPAWMNTGDLGGQLMRTVLRSRYGFDDTSIEDKLKVTYILDQKGINPIAFNAEEGLMILSSKTTEDPYNLSQWCFLEGHMGFDMCKREIRDNVMRLQVKKPINEYYMGLRQAQVEAIVNKRLGGAQPLWYKATVDVAGVNTELTKKQRDFRIRVDVSPTIFAETVTLELSVSI